MQVGKDIGSICRKCGDTWHVVVAMDGNRIVSVECKMCGGRHRFKSPDAPSTRRKAARKGTGAKRAAPREPAAFDPNRPIRTYRPTETFEAGDRIDHPKFGVGVVAAVAGPGKIQVEFPDTLRVLVQGR